jgi:glycosyltransferase involved in cell wall biosynthesis
LEGIQQAAHNPLFREQSCAVIAGHLDDEIQQIILNQLTKIRLLFPDFPIFLIDRLLNDNEFTGLISAADVVCLPYSNAPTTSGLLTQASAQGKIVCARDFGIVGELVRRYDLGITYSQQNSESIAQALFESISKATSTNFLEQERIKQFAVKFSIPIKEYGELICMATIDSVK